MGLSRPRSQDSPAAPQESFHFLPSPSTSRLSLLLGPRLGGRQEVFPTLTPPLTSAQPSCARRAGCTFPYLQHKTALSSPWSRPRPGMGGGRGRPCRHTGCIYQAQVLSHAIWGSSLYLIPVTSKWGPWWPEPLGFEVCLAFRGVGHLHLRAKLPLHLVP